MFHLFSVLLYFLSFSLHKDYKLTWTSSKQFVVFPLHEHKEDIKLLSPRHIKETNVDLTPPHGTIF